MGTALSGAETAQAPDPWAIPPASPPKVQVGVDRPSVVDDEARADAMSAAVLHGEECAAIGAPDERMETFVRAVAEVALAHGAAETAAHAASLFKFGTPAPLALSALARAALLDGNILEATDEGFHATSWFAKTSSAWQSMLRGEGGNLAACGESTLDGFTADLIACLVAKPSMASTIRRDLRRRGIAAFGMLDSSV